MTDEQFEHAKKSVNSQLKTTSKWIKDLTPDEALVYLRGIDGKLGAHNTKGTIGNILGMLAGYLHSLAEEVGVSYSTLLALITILGDDNIYFDTKSVKKILMGRKND